MKIPACYNTEIFQEMNIVKDHQSFYSEAKDHVFYDEQGRPEASIHTISYIKKTEEKDRPVLFFWNGGPGSATSTLQLECFGPWQMKADENGNRLEELVWEENNLLDICDLVFVDPVGVGYSRLLNPQAQNRYWSVDGDSRSNAFAVLDWIRLHQRWNSPVYFCGESYGTIRVCRILEEFGRDPMSGNKMMLGLPVAGVILIGVALSLNEKGSIIDDHLDLLTASLPSMAAVHWYQNLQGSCELRAFVDEAWQFAGEVLQPALFAGDDCSKELFEKAVKGLSHFTGMEENYFRASRLKLGNISDFMIQVAAGKGLRVDLYDGRKTQPLSGVYNPVGDANLPIRIMNGSLARNLGIGCDRLYYTGNINVNDAWDMHTQQNLSAMECLKRAMDRQPDMKVLTASGLYDLCTLVGNTRYIFSHSRIDKKRLLCKEYTGGHGVYSSKEGKETFLSDVRAMITENI